MLYPMESNESFLIVQEFGDEQEMATQMIFHTNSSELMKYTIMNCFLEPIFFELKKVHFYCQMVSKKEGRNA